MFSYLLLIIEWVHWKHLHKHQINGHDCSKCSGINIDYCPIHHLQQLQMFKLVMQKKVPTITSHTTSFLFHIIMIKLLIELSKHVQNHNFCPLRLSKNEISPNAKVLKHYIKWLKKLSTRKGRNERRICEFHYIVYFVTNVQKQTDAILSTKGIG